MSESHPGITAWQEFLGYKRVYKVHPHTHALTEYADKPAWIKKLERWGVITMTAVSVSALAVAASPGLRSDLLQLITPDPIPEGSSPNEPVSSTDMLASYPTFPRPDSCMPIQAIERSVEGNSSVLVQQMASNIPPEVSQVCRDRNGEVSFSPDNTCGQNGGQIYLSDVCRVGAIPPKKIESEEHRICLNDTQTIQHVGETFSSPSGDMKICWKGTGSNKTLFVGDASCQDLGFPNNACLVVSRNQ